jgi:hypothetical protein
MKRIRQTYSVSVSVSCQILLGLVLCGTLLAEQAPPSEIQRYRQQIDDCNQIIAGWQSQAHIQIFFIGLVIAFGALITIFQGVTKGWTKPVTLVLGASTTILTGINAQVFSADYRVLLQSAIDGSQLVDQLSETVDGLSRADADVTALRKQWFATKTQFAGLRKAVLQGTNKTADLRGWVRTVYAQSNVPAWINHPPADAYNVYFTGVAEDPDIAVARLGSIQTAVTTGSHAIAQGNGLEEQTLSQIVSASAVVDKSYFEFDKTKGVYRYYTLLRITSDIKLSSTDSGLTNLKPIWAWAMSAGWFKRLLWVICIGAVPVIVAVRLISVRRSI